MKDCFRHGVRKTDFEGVSVKTVSVIEGLSERSDTGFRLCSINSRGLNVLTKDGSQISKGVEVIPR